MTNTIENKAKFFALYWGQKLHISHGETYKIDYDSFISAWDTDPDDYLELTPLSQISDEDAFICATIKIGGAMNFINCKVKRNDKYGIWVKLNRENGSKEFYLDFNIPEVYDYLRSEGYALPYMGLSIEKLVEYGWIKLKNEYNGR